MLVCLFVGNKALKLMEACSRPSQGSRISFDL